MNHPSLHRFIRQIGTNNFVCFIPNDPKNPFGAGQYLLKEGYAGACVWDSDETAQTFINAVTELKLESVSTVVILSNEFPELKKYIQ